MSASLEIALVVLAGCLLAAFALQTVRTRTMLREILNRDRRLERASCKDDLTGLTNRRVFHEILERELAQARRGQNCIGLALLDVDDLQLINDGLGVSAGDEVLRGLARRLARSSRDSDTLARLSGDQFALIISKCEDVSEILTAIYRLRRTWESPLATEGHKLRVSCCVGLSVFPEDSVDANELLAHAGNALTQAQERGFNSIAMFDRSSDRLARKRLVRSQELKRALGRGELELYLQPQASLADGTLTGAEGLVRWRHPDEGLLTAGQFIPLAEQIGLMPDLSSWVVEEICRQNASWLAAGLPIVPISVNISVRHFQAGDVPATVARILERTGLDPRYLHLEVTESAALHDVELMTEQFRHLRALGVELELDDFGTGYSSLSYLMRYPLNVLKIDREFVTSLDSREESRAIVKATLAMADSLGLRVIAEGVERREELSCLTELGCSYAQGFLLGRPMPCKRFEKVLLAGSVKLPRSRAA